MGHLPQRLAARAQVILAAVEAGDGIAFDLTVGLAGELVALGGEKPEVRRVAARAKVVLAAIEAGDEIAGELMAGLAREVEGLGELYAAARARGGDAPQQRGNAAAGERPPGASFHRRK